VGEALAQPIRYAGPGDETHGVFPPPRPAADWPGAIAVTGTSPDEPSVLVRADLWSAFRELSLWIEALCVHEWSLFIEGLASSRADRGRAYFLLTSRPDNRRPLSWERNQIELLMLEGKTFVCPWTGKNLVARNYAIDHIIPVSVYPTNELWNLVPSDEYFNARTKRARMPTASRMASATLRLAQTYGLYMGSQTLGQALRSDLRERFALSPVSKPTEIAETVAGAPWRSLTRGA
jgi:HNH endonuclease